MVVAPISSIMVRMSVWDRPRQFIEMNENNRCSILFHFDAGRVAHHGDCQAGLGRESGEMPFPCPDPVPVRAASVGGDRQGGGVREPVFGRGCSTSVGLLKLDGENARLKRLLADAELDKDMLKEIASGKW